jgi:hypothetical protein
MTDTGSWRYALLADPAQRALGGCARGRRATALSARSTSAQTALGTDPFTSAVWAMAAQFDLPGTLDDADFYTELAERRNGTCSRTSPRTSTSYSSLRPRG